MQANRDETQCRAADVVATMLEADRIAAGRRYTDYRDISRRMGREMGRTLTCILKEGDTTVSTMADLAFICGYELHFNLKPRKR
jgi:hypothetical protein